VIEFDIPAAELSKVLHAGLKAMGKIPPGSSTYYYAVISGREILKIQVRIEEDV
jgi:hypothetical protein